MGAQIALNRPLHCAYPDATLPIPFTLAGFLSARTLSRRLGAEGTSFRAIQDEVRRELALALLADASKSIAEIAFFLGYAEPAPFHRSFRRWTGKTPQLHRRAILAG